MFCRKCGKEIPDDSVFCPECGEEIGKADEKQENNNSNELETEITSSKYTDEESKAIEKEQRKIKIGCITAVSVIVVIIVSILISHYVGANKKENNDAILSSVHYTIQNTEYSNTDHSKRLVLRVSILESSLSNASHEDIEKLLMALTQEAIKTNNNPDAVMIFLYKEGDNYDESYTVARSQYAPEGKWGNATFAADGEYDGYKYTIDIK